MTPDHKVFLLKTKNCKQKGRLTRLCQSKCKQNCPSKYYKDYKIEKLPISEATLGDYLIYPIDKTEKDLLNVRLYDRQAYLKKRNVKTGFPVYYFPERVKVDNDLLKLLGYWIAEGSTYPRGVRFSLGSHEKEFAIEICRLIKSIFGLDAHIHYRSGQKTGIEVSMSNAILAEVFPAICGKGAANKKIPDFCLTLPVQKQKIILGAIFKGDGTISRGYAKTRSGRKSITTVSALLASQLKNILLRIGYIPVTTYLTDRQDRKGVNHQSAWTVSWMSGLINNYSDILKVSEDLYYWLLPIRSIEKKPFRGSVYNLMVEDDSSYIVKNFAVGNCGEGGDIFTFVEKIEGLDFYNALKLLADRAGVELKKRSVQYGNSEFKADRKTALFEINDLSMRVYHKIFQDHEKAEPARKYMEKRGISDETISDFKIGYAPDSWDFLIRFLKKHGFSEEEMMQAGVVVRGEKGKYYDRFRGRIMFPISNIMGQTIAFTSRVLVDNAKEAKYLNSADSPIYTKGDVLYGLDKARMSIKEHDMAVVVEGNIDVIACHQAGFTNVVASSGTALTEQQLKILSRYGGEIAFCFDTDSAGETAMKRAITLAVKNDMTTKIVAIPPPFKDPDEAIKNSSKNWERAIENAKPSVPYWIDLLIRKNPELEITDKKKIAKEVLPVIKMTYSPIEKEAYIKNLSEKLSISEKSLLDALDKSKTDKIETKKSDFNKKELTTIDRLVTLVWHNQDLAEKLSEKVLAELSDENYPKFIEMIKKDDIDKEKLPENEVNKLSGNLMIMGEEIDLAEPEIILAEISYLSKRIESDQREDLRESFARRIKEAETRGDREAIRNLLNEFSSLIK